VGRRAHGIAAADVPQAATKLGRIRATVAALGKGERTSGEVARKAHMQPRHALYQLAAGRALGWTAKTPGRRHAITDRGRALLRTAPGSAAERAAFEDAVRSSALVRALAEGIDVRSRDAEVRIATRIQLLTRPSLAEETARERARTIAAWLRQTSSPQRALPLIEG
jgi:hypothetical protein